MERERAPRSFGENSGNNESARTLDRKFGREAMSRLGVEAVGGRPAGDTLDTVTAAMQKLGGDVLNRTPEVFSKLVRAADLPYDTKERLINDYKAGEDFSSLVSALGNQEGEIKALKHERLVSKIKSKIGKGVAIAAATVMLVGGIGVMYLSNANAKNVTEEAPVKIEETIEEEATEDEPEAEVEEAIEEVSILDDETLYANSNYENFNLDEIGDAILERFMDTGEGYEESENGVSANFTDYNDFENKTSNVACNTPISSKALEALKNGERDLYINEVMTKLTNNPANASSHLALIEPAMDAIGVPDENKSIEKYNERAQAIWDWVREQGKDADKEMLAALFVAYKADTTEFEVVTRTGDDWTMYETVENADEPISIENALLRGQSRIERDEAIQVITRMRFTDKDNNEVTVECVTNAMCVQITGKVIYTIKNPTTQEETVIEIELSDEPQDTSSSSNSSFASSTEKGSTTEESTTETGGDTEEEDEGGEGSTDEVKGKSAESLIEGVNSVLSNAGSDNKINQTESYDNASTDSGNYINNDNTVTVVDSNNDVVAVTDGVTDETVEVTEGYTEKPAEVTYKEPEVVQEAVSEGKTYTEDVKTQTQNENAEADALMSLLGGES